MDMPSGHCPGLIYPLKKILKLIHFPATSSLKMKNYVSEIERVGILNVNCLNGTLLNKTCVYAE